MLYSGTFSFEGTRRRQTSQGIKQSNYGGLVVNSSSLKRILSSESTALLCILSITLQYFGTDLRHSCLKSFQENFSCRGRDWACFFSLPIGKDLFYLFLPTKIILLTSLVP
jgi:hypothetical protein